jgi:micrococcal nuclease
MFGGKYNPERWIGLALAILGIFYLGYFWPQQNVLKHRPPTLFSAEEQGKQNPPNPLENRLNDKTGDVQELSKALPEGDLSSLANAETVKAPGQYETTSEKPSERVSCHVLMVFDGDTLGCDINSNGKLNKPEEEIRLLGIDSPEMHYSRKNPSYHTANPHDEPFAKEASQWLAQQATGKTLYLESDLKPFDRYGRRLAYVYTSPSAKESLNEQALRTGFYQTLFLGKNRRYQNRFESALSEAQKHQLGLWKAQ